ncbi:MAG: hypothetical protein JJT75_09750 [Opitutales bacterium]|nr:hypothetical protein [Opitutales bacterium]MCH8539967.1 hypothetical protein [Opitutales bacterium]
MADFSRITVFLTDNGSLRPSSTLALRRIAEKLAPWARREFGVTLEPASLLHSSRIPAEDLGGEKAEIVYQRIKRLYREEGRRRFIVLPLFIGPSRALTEYLPAKREEWKGRFPGLDLRIGPPLYREGDPRMTEILAELIQPFLRDKEDRPLVALTDHGSPEPKVTEVRNQLALELGRKLGNSVEKVAPASMERREGKEYGFSDPLLANLLNQPGWTRGRLVVSMLFLLPGRHAGEGGDVVEIIENSQKRHPGRVVEITPLLGESPRLVEVLRDRLVEVLSDLA